MRPGDPFAPPPEELGDPFAEDRGGKKPALQERWGAYWESGKGKILVAAVSCVAVFADGKVLIKALDGYDGSSPLVVVDKVDSCFLCGGGLPDVLALCSE